MKAKRCIIVMTTVLLVILSSVRVETQQIYEYYYPFFAEHHCGRPKMGLWSYIAPTATINRVTNPSLETNITGWNNSGLATMARTGTEQKFGVYSLLCLANSQFDNGWIEASGFTAAATVTISAWVRATTSDVVLVFTSRPGGALIGTTPHSGSGEWERLELTGALSGGETVVRVQVQDNRLAAYDNFYVDAAQAEELTSVTTYCDGDQSGCEWLGAEHASISQRSALSRAGGIVTDFADLDFDVTGFVGTGKAPITLNVDNYALLPGGELNSQKTNVRSFTLTGWIQGTSLSDLHVNRQALIDAVSINQTPENQPVILRYTGASVVKEIEAYYQTGLGGNIRAQFECLEQSFALRFLATSPNFREVGESSDILDTEDTATLRYAAGRLRSTGQWDDLGLTANPTAVGPIYAVLRASDGSVYFGGDFTGMDGVAGRDYIARYIPFTDSWETVGGASDLNAAVYALVEASNGDIYVGGAFTNADGIAAADTLAIWDGSSWSAVGVPNAGAAVLNNVRALRFLFDGTLYIGGDFINWANIASADYIVSWNGASYSALSTGLNSVVRAIEEASDGTVYVGGLFTNAGGDADADYLAQYNGTVFSNVGGGAFAGGTQILALLIDQDGETLYIGGTFTNADGIADADGIVKWTSQAFEAVGGGVSLTAGTGVVNSLALAPSGLILVGGDFDGAGELVTLSGLVIWNGSSWINTDVALPAPTQVLWSTFGQSDPVVTDIYDIWIGFSNTGSATFDGTITVANDGTQDAYPTITISRSGGTSASVISIRNESLGLEILFNYSLLDGETLTIDLSPTNKSVTSSIFGLRLDAVLPNSDFGIWRLRPGDNLISCFVDVAGGSTIVGTIVHSDQYWSMD